MYCITILRDTNLYFVPYQLLNHTIFHNSSVCISNIAVQYILSKYNIDLDDILYKTMLKDKSG